MAYNQVSGDKAFYLNRKGGGDHWTHADKRLAADLVEQFAFSQNLEEARGRGKKCNSSNCCTNSARTAQKSSMARIHR
jgi:hypothetical protein